MPYIIYVPLIPRSFVTNNPVIYMDARLWGWKVEARRYQDEYCEYVWALEKKRGETERRIVELETIWKTEVDRRLKMGAKQEPQDQEDEEAMENGAAQHAGGANESKVEVTDHGVPVEIEIQGPHEVNSKAKLVKPIVTILPCVQA